MEFDVPPLSKMKQLKVADLPVFFIDLVSKAHGVDDSEFEAHVALLKFIGVGLERDSRLVVLGGLTFKLGVEQRVHQSGLTQTRLTCTTKRKYIKLLSSSYYYIIQITPLHLYLQGSCYYFTNWK